MPCFALSPINLLLKCPTRPTPSYHLRQYPQYILHIQLAFILIPYANLYPGEGYEWMYVKDIILVQIRRE